MEHPDGNDVFVLSFNIQKDVLVLHMCMNAGIKRMLLNDNDMTWCSPSPVLCKLVSEQSRGWSVQFNVERQWTIVPYSVTYDMVVMPYHGSSSMFKIIVKVATTKYIPGDSFVYIVKRQSTQT